VRAISKESPLNRPLTHRQIDERRLCHRPADGPLFPIFPPGHAPAGLFFDPAINGLDATRLMQRGGPVLFFPTNGGRESMFMFMLIPLSSFLAPPRWPSAP
jgi:hypothetical protein